jgi:hypothetical protein
MLPNAKAQTLPERVNRILPTTDKTDAIDALPLPKFLGVRQGNANKKAACYPVQAAQ